MRQLLQICFLLFLGAAAPLSAQETVSTAGGNGTGAGGSFAYTVGQVVFTAPSGVNGMVSQGVQQPYEISITTGQNETGVSVNCIVYPNPTANELQLEVTNIYTGSLAYHLYDSKGSLIYGGLINGVSTRLSLIHCVPGTYNLKMQLDGNEIKSYRIIKR